VLASAIEEIPKESSPASLQEATGRREHTDEKKYAISPHDWSASTLPATFARALAFCNLQDKEKE